MKITPDKFKIPRAFACDHEYEFDEQAGVTQCFKCGKIKYLSHKKNMDGFQNE